MFIFELVLGILVTFTAGLLAGYRLALHNHSARIREWRAHQAWVERQIGRIERGEVTANPEVPFEPTIDDSYSR